MNRYAPSISEIRKFTEQTGIGLNSAIPLLTKKNMLETLSHYSSPDMQAMQDALIGLLELELKGVRFPGEESGG